MRQECVDLISQATGKRFTSEQGDALKNRIKAKMVTLKRSTELRDMWHVLSEDERIMQAAKEVAKDMQYEAERKKTIVVKTILCQDRIAREQHRLATEDDIHAYAGVARILQDTYKRARGVQNEFLSEMLDTINGIKSKWLGFVEDAEDVAAFVKEAFGEDSGNEAAKKAWEAWDAVAEKMRQRAIRAGADIGKLDYGYIPQTHDWVKVRKAGQQAWIQEVLPKLDKERYITDAGEQMSDKQIIEQELIPAWTDIVTSGNPSGNIFDIKEDVMAGARFGLDPVRGSKQHRVLHFKDAESFLTYESKYGSGSLTSTLIGHVAKMSNDIAIIETLGPQPEATLSMMKGVAEGEAMNARMSESQFRLLTGYSDGMGLTRVSIDDMWNVLVGKASQAAPNREGVANFMSGFRNFEIMGKLGKAFITSLSDIPTYFITTGFNKLDLFQGLQFLGRAYGKDWKDYANRMGFLADSISSDFNRWGHDNIGQGWTSKLANATMKASFLEAWTNATRRAFCLNMMAGLGKLIDTPWAELTDYDRARLVEGGISETEWNMMRFAGSEDYNGIKFLSMDKLKALKDNSDLVERFDQQDLIELPSKVIGFVVNESEMASLNPDLVTRTETSRGLQRGTVGGEFARCLFLFKSFPIAMMERQWRRAQFLNRKVGKCVGYEYLAAIAVATTVFGGLSLQIQNMLNGKDLQDVESKQFWLNAMAKGGGLGFIGDYLAYGIGEDSMYGAMSGATNLLGPVAGSIVGASDVLTSAVGNAIYDKHTKTGAKAVRLARQHLPFMNLWYASTVIDRAFMDELQDYLSPGYSRAKESRLRRGTGQGYWWAPGELTPDRGVEMAEKPRR